GTADTVRTVKASSVSLGFGDADGDGDAELGIARYDSATDTGTAWSWRGQSTWTDSSPDNPNPVFSGSAGDSFGAASGPAGDFNGDGMAEGLVGIPANHQSSATGSAIVYLSPIARALTLKNNSGDTAPYFGRELTGVGDVNSDGYDDIVVSNNTFSYLSLGGPSPSGTAAAIFQPPPFSVPIKAGDLNDDGYDDIVFGPSTPLQVLWGSPSPEK